MAIHIDIDDPKYRNAVAEILRRHDRGEPEANITSAVRDFLILTGLARSEEMLEENPPSDASRRAVDLTALDTFIEFKRRIGTASGGAPNPQYVEQLDDYLTQSASRGRVRMGVLTDGKRWLLRWPRAGEVRLTHPYAFTLEEPDHWIALHNWLRDSVLVSLEGESPDREGITGHFGPESPSYQRDIAALKTLYLENAEQETIRIKRRLWYDLLRTALGEIAYTTEGMSAEAQARLAKVGVGPEEMDDLFVRHTYLSAVIGMVVQASFGIDIRRLAETDPADLLQGRELYRATGLRGVLESDFFAWPNEVGGKPLLQTLARRVARFDWTEAPPDTAATLYESVIPPEERRQLGEYYTPAWVARAMMRELVDDPLNQHVLDPACGSGTFVAEAVSHFIAAAAAANWEPREVLNKLREAVTGIDVHPVAVHLARAAWTLAARPAINAASAADYDASLSIPVYLGDALQLRFRTGDMFAEHNITVQVEDEENTELVFPVSLVERAEAFDALMGDVSTSIERGDDPFLALDDNNINDSAERQVIGNTIATMKRLHDKGRNHIWAYYARDMVRPVVLSRSKVDVVIGNPPWINYNQTADILRDELLNLSRNAYDIWAGGRYATQQDVAGLFFARSVDLYLKDGGVIGFVLPHSALQAGQYSQVAQRSVEGAQVRAERLGGLHSQTGLGPGTVEAQHFLPRARLGGVRPQALPGRIRQAPGRFGGTVAGKGGRGQRAAGAGRHHRHRQGGRATLCRAVPERGHDISKGVVLRQRNGEHRHRAGRADGHRQPSSGHFGQGALEGPGPDRHHRPDGREPACLRRAPWGNHRPLRCTRALESAATTKAGRRCDSHRRQRPRWHPVGRAGTADAGALADGQPSVGGQQGPGQQLEPAQSARLHGQAVVAVGVAGQP